ATGDHAGTFRRRLHEHAGRAMAGLDRVEQGAAIEVDTDHVLARGLHRLLDRDRHFARLAVAEADLAVAVAHHRQRGEGELATALDRLADAVDRDQLLDHAVVHLFPVAIAVAPAGFTLFCHCHVSVRKGICGVAAYGCGLERWTASVGHKPRSVRCSPHRQGESWRAQRGNAAPPWRTWPWMAGPDCPEATVFAMDGIHDRIFKRRGQTPRRSIRTAGHPRGRRRPAP